MKQIEDTQTIDLIEAASATPSAAAAIDVVPINEAAVQSASSALATLTDRQREVQKLFGDGLTYQRERVMNELKFWAGNAAQAWMEMGKRLLVVKENEPHGFFKTACDELQIHPRTAQRMMLAAAKFLSNPALAQHVDKFVALGRSKILDLSSESDETLELLAKGQPLLSGLVLDEMQCMSSRELQVKLKEARAIDQAKDRLITQKNTRIDQLETELTRPYQPKPGALAQTAAAERLLKGLAEKTAAAATALMQLRAVAQDLIDDGALGDAGAQAIEGSFGYVIATTRDQVNGLGLTLDSSNEAFGMAPDWLTQ